MEDILHILKGGFATRHKYLCAWILTNLFGCSEQILQKVIDKYNPVHVVRDLVLEPLLEFQKFSAPYPQENIAEDQRSKLQLVSQ
jgi:hypothetical protein